MSDDRACPLRVDDVVRCDNVFDKAWRDGMTESEENGSIVISDGRVWVSHCDPPGDTERTIRQEHRLSDKERVDRFSATGQLGPETEVRESTVRVSRRVRQYFRDAIVVQEPVAVAKGVWHVVVTKLDPTASIGEPRFLFNFYLAADGADCGQLDERKIVHEKRIFILPSQAKPLFGPWSTCQAEVRMPTVGNILSGAELRWYLSGVDREAEYIVVEMVEVLQDIQACAVSSTPRDCRDEWCGLRHHQKTISVKAGIRVTARKIRMDEDTGRPHLLDGEIAWFRSTDQAFRDSLEGHSVHVGGDRNRNFVFGR